MLASTPTKTKINTQNDGLEKVAPFKHSNFLGIHVRFLGCMLLISDHPNLQLQLLKGHLELLLLFNQVETKFLLSLLSRDSCYYRSCYYLVVAETEQEANFWNFNLVGISSRKLAFHISGHQKLSKKRFKKACLWRNTTHTIHVWYTYLHLPYIYIYINGWYGQGSTPSRLPAELPIDPLPRVKTPLQLASTSSSQELMDQWGEKGSAEIWWG